ncbi:MAG: hypothetical protein LCH92_08040 [Proteobacteria bacterium]|nr:hypothetical protein [Pseudomonadota bacterium]
MNSFAIFANGAYWGTWASIDAESAMQAAADEVGTEGNTDGLVAHEVTADQVTALDEWSANGSPASECPIKA